MKRVQPPAGSDWDDAARELGAEAAAQILIAESAPPDPLDWLEDFELTDNELREITDQRWVVPGLIPAGHITAVCGRAGAGKTTILFESACTEVVAAGYRVIYVHADTYPAEAKGFTERARAAGVRYLTPDLKRGVSMPDVLKRLAAMADAGEDLADLVVYFDTLKKLALVIQKNQMVELMKALRRLTGRGATVVLLGHVNKHKGPDGQDVYEGTGDLQNDCDNLFFLVPTKSGDGLLVSTKCDPPEGVGKMRAQLQPMTWEIGPDRRVIKLTEYVDTSEIHREAEDRAADATYIEGVAEAINAGHRTQLAITTYCNAEYKMGEKKLRAVLGRWEGKLWDCDRSAYAKNRKLYTLRSPGLADKLPNRPT